MSSETEEMSKRIEELTNVPRSMGVRFLDAATDNNR
jgi:hypothetical protein